MNVTLSSPISTIRGIGPALAKRFARLGIQTALDLLLHFPTRHDDLRSITPIVSAPANTMITAHGRITHIESHRSPRRRMNLTEAIFSDDSDSLHVVWFNQPFLAKSLLPGDEVYLTGKIVIGKYGRQMMSPQYEKAKNVQTHVARIVPLYPATEKLSQKQIRFAVQSVIERAKDLADPLPADLVERERLMPRAKAVQEIHFPRDERALAAARARLKFDELLLVQLRNLLTRRELQAAHAPAIAFHQNDVKAFVDSLPFLLTTAQKKCAWTILQDLAKRAPMNRLLNGDVGTGKTVVAGIACYNAAVAGYQSVIMAPTEILAEQHFNTLSKIFPEDVSIGILTNHAARSGEREMKKPEFKKQIAEGHVSVVIGTHAIIQDDVRFRNLGFAVVDEQHRFGVEQRKTLLRENGNAGTTPHFLSMTATPIPRTLALSIYGDLDISILDEFPKGRKPIVTKVVANENRDKAYAFIHERIRAGRQAFVVCPLIEESDMLGVKSVTQEFEKLRRIFVDLRVEMLHGKMKSAEKERMMEKIKNHEVDILVSTSVIEVGIDVPNATIMMIEGADRFGLAQLHQFRGRVGRGAHQSFCFLFTDSGAEKTRERLQILCSTTNGFVLAEKDLQMRGSGDILGTRQSGFPAFKIATIFDFEIAKTAGLFARTLLERDPSLARYPLLQDELARFERAVHFE